MYRMRFYYCQFMQDIMGGRVVAGWMLLTGEVDRVQWEMSRGRPNCRCLEPYLWRKHVIALHIIICTVNTCLRIASK